MTDRRAETGPHGWATALILVGLALLISVRMPEIIIKGRFWAEDGRDFFRNAWVMPPWRAIWTPDPGAGYINLVASAAAVAARWFLPLRFAPYLTIGVALFFQLMPPVLLLTARDVWLRDVRVRLAAVLLILLIPSSEEVWLASIESQYLLMLCCGIILALDPCEGWIAVLRVGLLVVAPLSGPGAIALLPIFVLRAAVDRSWPRVLQVFALGTGTAIQLFGFFTMVPGRARELHLTILLSILTVRHIALPFLGSAHAEEIAAVLRSMIQEGHRPLAAVLLPVVIFVGLLVAASRVGIRRPAVWLLGGGVLTAGISYFGAFIPHIKAVVLVSATAAERYTFAPQALFALSILALAATSGRRVATLAWAASVWLLVIGTSEYFFQDWPADGPAWRPQIAGWQADPNRNLQIWPAGWAMQLQRLPGSR